MTFELLKGFQGLYEKLIIADVKQQLPGSSITPIEVPDDNELSRLIALASCFALSDEIEKKEIAYEVATRTLEIKESGLPAIVSAAEVILARLGNFPGRKLLLNNYGRYKKNCYLSVEIASHEIENTVNFLEKSITLTDFQFDLFHSLAEHNDLSFSAPTSAGKSYVLGLTISKIIKEKAPSFIVYIVPTRALIRQVMEDVIKSFKEFGIKDIPVRCIPMPITQNDAPNGAVYVLTQERLLSLLSLPENSFTLTHLIVDEAQSIKDGSRGILLQSATEQVIQLFPDIQTFFASPLIKNPDYLLQLFKRKKKEAFSIETASPVSQNLILVSEVKGKPSQVLFEFQLPKNRLELGRHQLDFDFRGGIKERRAKFARAITQEDDCTIVFCNGPKETEDVAEKIHNDKLTEIDAEILIFIEFLKEHLHKEYPLIKCLRNKAAYHYGYMPPLVRIGVEELFQAGKLNFICCTSTLLQGINLPARNIIIEAPKSGRGNPMVRADFLNLAGRAGRLLKEFHGNVWCIQPEKWEIPENSDLPCFIGEKLQVINAAFEEEIGKGAILIDKVVADQESNNGKDFDKGVTALGKVFAEFILSDRVNEIKKLAINQVSAELLSKTMKKCSEIKVSLPEEIFRKNLTVSIFQ